MTLGTCSDAKLCSIGSGDYTTFRQTDFTLKFNYLKGRVQIFECKEFLNPIAFAGQFVLIVPNLCIFTFGVGKYDADYLFRYCNCVYHTDMM